MDVKIDCHCGTRYGFDVEPENGRMPCLVSCPRCGSDGTTLANAFIQSRSEPTARARPMRVTLGGQSHATDTTASPSGPPPKP